jgi:hypothetical protein
MNCTVWAGAGVASDEEKTKVAVISSSPRTGHVDIIHLEVGKQIQMNTVLTKASLPLAEAGANWLAVIRRNADRT